MYKKQQSTWNIRHLVYVSSSLFFFSSWSSQSEVHRHYKLEMNSKWFGCFFPPLEMVCWVLPSHTHNHLKIWAVNSSLQGHHSLDPASPGVGGLGHSPGSFSNVQSRRTENSCPPAFPLTACSTTGCQYTDQPWRTKVSHFLSSSEK